MKTLCFFILFLTYSCYFPSSATACNNLQLRIYPQKVDTRAFVRCSWTNCERRISPYFFRNGVRIIDNQDVMVGDDEIILALGPRDEGTWKCGVMVSNEFISSREIKIFGMFYFLKIYNFVTIVI